MTDALNDAAVTLDDDCPFADARARATTSAGRKG